MENILLYLGTVFIWGSSWFALKFQVSAMDPVLAVSMRFAGAAALMGLWVFLARSPLRFSPSQHKWIALMGFSVFGLNYIFFYLATVKLTSGLVALVASLLSLMNILNSWFYRGLRPNGRVTLGAFLGVCGIALVFWTELTSLNLEGTTTQGLLLALAGTYWISTGNVASAHLQSQGVPVVSATFWAMLYGLGLQGVYHFINGTSFAFQGSESFWGTYVFLVLIATVLGFWLYLTLIGKVGADRAGYAFIIMPLVALVISTFFENYTWQPHALLGVALVLGGNLSINLWKPS